MIKRRRSLVPTTGFGLAVLLAGLVALFPLISPMPAGGAEKTKTFTFAVSSYAGWMPWYYADEEKILQKWADRYGIKIVVKYMDYVPSVEAYVAGQADAVAMTNMETLDMPAASEVDTTVILIGDYSNGNDAILAHDKISIADLKGKKVYLAERTVSQYLLSRALVKAKMREADLTTVNVSEGDIQLLARKAGNVVVTWNPTVMEVEKIAGVTKLFDSAQIPGEIQDVVAINTRVLKGNPDLARALMGTWFEVMSQMNETGGAGDKAIKKMAELAKTSEQDFRSQLKTTSLFWTPKAELDYLRSSDLKQKQELVRDFCFTHGLLGENARTAGAVGICYPDSTVLGDKKNVKMRFADEFAAELVVESLRRNR